MLKLKRPVRILLPVCAPALAALLIAGPAAAERAYYTWRTDDGAYAFTDDVKAIPEAYRKQAERRTLRSLESYGRLTPSDARASSDYAKRLDARLAELRERGQRAVAPEAAAAAAPAGRPGSAPAITLRTGDDESPTLEISPTEAGGGPVIVETVSARREQDIVTHDNTIVRQGDRTLAIVRSRPRQWNISEDIHIESDLE
jgi:hypothetical protein